MKIYDNLRVCRPPFSSAHHTSVWCCHDILGCILFPQPIGTQVRFCFHNGTNRLPLKLNSTINSNVDKSKTTNDPTACDIAQWYVSVLIVIIVHITSVYKLYSCNKYFNNALHIKYEYMKTITSTNIFNISFLHLVVLLDSCMISYFDGIVFGMQIVFQFKKDTSTKMYTTF